MESQQNIIWGQCGDSYQLDKDDKGEDRGDSWVNNESVGHRGGLFGCGGTGCSFENNKEDH